MAAINADNPPQQEELDLRSYLRPIWRRKLIIIVVTILAAAATYVISNGQTKQYTASTGLYVQNADPVASVNAVNVGAVALTSDQVASVAELVTGQDVRTAVARQLGISYKTAGDVSSTPSSTSSFVTITATVASGPLAARLANAYATQFLQSRRAAVVAVARRGLRTTETALLELPKARGLAGAGGVATLAQRSALSTQLSNFQQAMLNPSAGAQQVSPAVVPAVPSSPKPKRDAVFGGVLGLLLSVMLAFALELLDRRLVSVSTIEAIFERPVLAVLPHVADPNPLVDGKRPAVPEGFVEELRSLAVMLRLSAGENPPKSILITSTLPSEGKSTVTRDLALIYAEQGNDVLVIDADLRRPSVGRLFGVSSEKGLVHVLRGEVNTDTVIVTPADSPSPGHDEASTNGNGPHAASDGSISLVLHGATLSNPVTLLSSSRMSDLITGAAQRYDIVLIDTPPILAVVDGVPLLEVVDSVIVVARVGQTTRGAADRFRAILSRLDGVNVSGVVANDYRALADNGYGSYGTYGYGPDDASANGGRSKAPTSA